MAPKLSAPRAFMASACAAEPGCRWNRCNCTESKHNFCPPRSSSRQIVQLSVDSSRLKVFGMLSRPGCHYKSVFCASGTKSSTFESGADVAKPADWSTRRGKKARPCCISKTLFSPSGTSACYRNITQQVSIVVRLSDKSKVYVMTAPRCWISSCSTPWDQMKAMQTLLG